MKIDSAQRRIRQLADQYTAEVNAKTVLAGVEEAGAAQVSSDAYNTSRLPPKARAALDEIAGLLRDVEAELDEPGRKELAAQLPGDILKALEVQQVGSSPRDLSSLAGQYVQLGREVVQSWLATAADFQKYRDGLGMLYSSYDPTMLRRRDLGAQVEAVAEARNAGELAKSNPDVAPDELAEWERAARDIIDEINGDAQHDRPNLPPHLLLKGAYGEGRGTAGPADLAQAIANGSIGIEDFYGATTGALEREAKLSELGGALDAAIRPDLEGFETRAARLASPSVTAAQLFSEARALISGIEALGNANGITPSESVRIGQTTPEMIQPRKYKIMAMPFRGLIGGWGTDTLVRHPFTTLHAVGLLADTLMELQQVYDALTMREPDGPHTRALASYVEGSTFEIGELRATPKEDLAAPVATLTASGAREGAQKLARAGMYPNERLELLERATFVSP
jgi:hypothetical protein